MKTFLHLMLFVLVFSLSTSGQTFTTISNGNWNATSTWLAGKVPPATITAAQTVNVNHQVNFNLDVELKVYGKLNVTGGTLQFPSAFSKRTTVFAGGQLLVLNGSFLQSTADRNSDVYADGGRMRFDNAVVKIGKAFNANAGSRRIFKNSTIQVGEGYESAGSSSASVFDTIQYSTIEVSVAGGGHFTAKDYCHMVLANANIFVHNGDMKVADQASVSTHQSAADNYAFNKLKISHHLDNAAPWTARIYSYCIDGDIKGSKAAEVDFVRAEDCSLPAPAPSSNSGQLVVNEIYTDPNAGNHEFFELYNIGNQPESADNYTLITFFKNDSEKGFYVLDMPNLMIEPRAFFVGAAAFPFNFQSQTNSIFANFNWSTLSPSSNGKLTKWVQTAAADITDGNLFYNSAALPATGVNDFFSRITGDNSFTIFLFKNGTLVNRMITGAGGSNTLSSLVTSMPLLFINMQGSAPDFSINFSSMATIPVEAVSMDAGSDNGFIRETDGACGTWKKSSSSVTHTPQQPNGTLNTSNGGTIDITSFITKGTAAAGSTVTYTVTSSSNVFPVELRVYVDKGVVPGQFDLSDSLVDTKSATASGQTFTSTFKPFDADILIVVRQASGCIDRIKFTQQATLSTLPVAFEKLTGRHDNNSNLLKWRVSDHAETSHYIVQRSTDQRNYRDIAYVISSASIFDYEYKDRDLTSNTDKYFYRIKAYSKDGKVTISNICLIRSSNEVGESRLLVYPNPFNQHFSIVLPPTWIGKDGKIEIVASNGVVIKTLALKQANNNEFVKTEDLNKGAYLLRVSCNGEVLHKTLLKN